MYTYIMDHIIIHIPKTGGTTLINYLNKGNLFPNFYYRHLSYKDTKSNSADIFDTNNIDYYKKYKIIFILRDPINRLESEFNFLINRTHFIDKYKIINNKNYPDNFLEYINNTSSHNSICKFLLGKEMFSTDIISEYDYNNIIHCLNELNIIYGITEDYDNIIKNINYLLNLNFTNTNIDNKRANLLKNERNQSWSQCISRFNEYNKYDNLLYEFILNKFNTQINLLPDNIKNITLTFKNNYYEYFFGYLTGIHCKNGLIQLLIQDKEWLNKNDRKLTIINNILLSKLKNRIITDGKQYCTEWSNVICKTFKLNYILSDDIELYEHVQNICKELIKI